MKKTSFILAVCFVACFFTTKLQAQTEIPYFPLETDFGGTQISDAANFIPNTGDYTLEVQGTAGTEINIAFAGISYTPTASTKVRFIQKNGKVYIFENGVFKNVFTPNPEYTTSGNNILQNPSFEEVSEELTSGRWKPTVWDTWNGGMPTWGGDVGKTNVREDANYRSNGTKSIIMHSETRQLLQELPNNSLQAGENYLLTYDYWTSSGNGNGGSTYQIHLRSERYTTGSTWLQNIGGHTTLTSGTAKSSFSTIFQISENLSQTLYFVLVRNEAKVDWLDNFKLYKIVPAKKGITGASSITYLTGTAYAPGNLSFENGDYIDMTGRVNNPAFDNGTNGWEISASGSKISTSEKANGLIPANQNHLQFWVSSGGVTGKLSQSITNLPNGKYALKAAIAPSFNGMVSLYANSGKASVTSGTSKYYETTGIVFDGSLEIGLEMATSGSPTIDIDDFKLYYLGIDGDGYLEILNAKIAEAIADTIAMKNTNGKPGYNNLQQYRDALDEVKNRADDAPATLIAALATINAVIGEYDAILAAYKPLKTAMTELTAQLNASAYPTKTTFLNAISAAQTIYDSTEDQRKNIEATIAMLAEKKETLIAYAELKSAITSAATMLNTTNYAGKTDFRTAIDAAQEVVSQPEGKNITAALAALKTARAVYYNSQYTQPAVQQTVSWVDVSLNGSEKFVLRVDGKPFYMTNIQVRLDKLYGYEGWGDAALEAVIKRAADDGFNTVSIPIHWREIEPVKDEFDWTILDKFLGWCKKYNLKTELLWFSWSSGGRVQWLWNYGGRKELRTPDYVCSSDGKSEYNVLRKDWEYSLDWRDANLYKREKYVVGQMMEHIAVWDANNENPQTVIGVQLGNEARGHGNNGATSAEIINYYHHVGAGVKESKYVVWTRLNCVSYETSGRISANESKRNNGGTNIDFVGVDIYGHDAGMIKGDMWGYLPTSGKNYRMIMEIDAKDSKSPLYQMAALAGDKAFDYYNMGHVDGNGLYTNNGQTLVERDHIALVRQRNKILNLANQDIALKKQGVGLYVYNYAGTSTSAETGIEGIVFTPNAANTQAIAIRRSQSEVVLLSTSTGTFTIPASLGFISARKGYFDENNKWVDEGEVTLNGTKLTMPATSAVLLQLKGYQPEDGIQNPSFERGTTSVGGVLVPVSWTLESTLSGSDLKLSTTSPADGLYKYNIWASSITSVNLFQDVELPAGEFTLKAAMRTDNDANITDQHIYVQVGNNNPIKSNTLTYTTNPLWQTLSVDFTVSANETIVRVGAASTGNKTTAGWFQIDDFRLEKKNTSNTTPITSENNNSSLKITNTQGGIIIQGKSDIAQLNIYSVLGQIIKTVSVTTDQLFISLAKGIYIVGNQKIIVK